MRAASARGLADQAIGAEYIAHYLTETMQPDLPLDAQARPPTIPADALARGGRIQGRRRRLEGRSAA